MKTPSRAASTRRHGVTLAKKTVHPDAVSLLRTDHKTLRQLLTELQSAEKPAERQRLLVHVKRELTVHTTIEEEIFYPAFRAAARSKQDEQLFHEATAEHHAAELILHEVARADDATGEFPGRAKVLKELVTHHAEEEETDMFPRARELIGAAELRALGQQMAERKRVLLHADAGGGGTLQKMADFVVTSFSSPSRTAPEPRA
jgi:hemerythrin superfamily protein